MEGWHYLDIYRQVAGFDKGFGLQDRGAGIYVSVATDPALSRESSARVRAGSTAGR